MCPMNFGTWLTRDATEIGDTTLTTEDWLDLTFHKLGTGERNYVGKQRNFAQMACFALGEGAQLAGWDS